MKGEVTISAHLSNRFFYRVLSLEDSGTFTLNFEMTDYLFVYGTLRKHANSPAKWLLMDNAEYLGEGKINAKLYRVSWYPAAVACKERDETTFVIGDVFRLNHLHKTLNRLDEYEDVPVLYERTLMKVQMNRGMCLDAWVYLYKQSVQHLSEIKSGDFLNP